VQIDVSGMVWIPRDELGADGIAFMQRKLRIVPKKYRGFDDTPPRPLKLYINDRERERFGIPRRYFFDTATGSHDVTWSYVEGEEMAEIECLLRQEGKYAEQADAIGELLGWFGGHDDMDRSPIEAGKHLGGLLRGATGFGKTNTALALLHRLGRASVIVVHKEFLLRQWVNRIHKFLPDAKVGIAQGPKCEFEDCDFILAMAQSLAKEGEGGKRRYPKDFYRYPGVVVVDEVHRIGAETWSPIPALFPARYRLGLTATPRRKDGCDKVFWWNIGEIVYAATTETPKPLVRVIDTGTAGYGVLGDKAVSPAITINVLTKTERRNDVVAREALKAARRGRKVLVISERLEQLRVLEEAIRARAGDVDGFSVGFYVGEWFTGEKTLSLRKVRKLTDDERELAIATIYRKFRRRRWIDGDKTAWPCATKIDDEHRIALFDHGYRVRVLEFMADKQLCQLARDYDIAQAKSKPKTKTRTEEELTEAERAHVVFATYQMCSEGVDIPALDTEVLASPVSDIEQAAGRIRRWCIPERFGGDKSPEDCAHYCAWRADTCEGKPDPIIADIVDDLVPLSSKRKKYRMAFYRGLKTRVAGDV
jgi:superfamily II DNA or RNA helicase